MGDEANPTGGTPAPTPAPAGGQEDRSTWVAPHRLRETNEKLAAALQEVERLKPLAAQYETLKGEFTEAKTAWADERAGLAVGLDAEGIGVARHLYGGLPATDRPKFADWIQAQREKPSRALSPWFTSTTPSPNPTPSPTPAPTPGPVPVPAPTPALPAPGGEGQKSTDQIIADAMRTGDWSQYNQIRAGLLKPRR